MRGVASVAWIVAGGVTALLEGCGAPPIPEDSLGEDPIALGHRYESDPAFRRDALFQSLVNPNNAYARKRLALYDEEHWGALPLWNPKVKAIDVSSVVPPAPDDTWTNIDVDGVPWEEVSLIALGRRAFFQYPLQLVSSLQQALGEPARAAFYGLWVHEGAVAATVWTAVPTGPPRAALTCATCHASVLAGELVEGRNNPDLDLERLAFDADQAAVADPTTGRPGRVDVTDDGFDNPTAIADLRAVRWQLNLHRAATLKNGLVALAIRTETLIITSLDEAVRPPRKLAFALALYLYSLEPRPLRAMDEAATRGEVSFVAHCATCHSSPGFSGEPVLLDVVGTDPAVGSSPDRATGHYRVPALRGVGDRRRLFAGGKVFDLRELLDPVRAARGHRFGLELSSAQLGDLLAYLETL